MMRFAGKSAAMSLSQIAISPLSMVLTLALIIPLAVMFSALLIAIAVSARNYKEGTSMLSPFDDGGDLPRFCVHASGNGYVAPYGRDSHSQRVAAIKEFMAGNYPVVVRGDRLWEHLCACGGFACLGNQPVQTGIGVVPSRRGCALVAFPTSFGSFAQSVSITGQCGSADCG